MRDEIFTENGQVMFLSIRDNVRRLLKQAGAVRMQEAIAGTCGDSWLMLACVDRLVELGELRELFPAGYAPPAQDRVFVSSIGEAA
jgi:hypothetical protein